jgi:D-sedoheptulose 7-phosphate isomerase
MNRPVALWSDAALLRHVEGLFERSIALKQQVVQKHAGDIVAIARHIFTAVAAGRKVLFCGNGGSAADAQHLAAELLVRLRPQVNRRPIAALSLAADMSSLTACCNDLAYDAYFERMVQALGVQGDVLVGLTTSGTSVSIVRALAAAREQQLITIGLLGGAGRPALDYCDTALLVPSSETGRVQEAHITIGHAVLELVEEMWLGSNP